MVPCTWSVEHDLRCIARGALCVVRGTWSVARDAWCVVRNVLCGMFYGLCIVAYGLCLLAYGLCHNPFNFNFCNIRRILQNAPKYSSCFNGKKHTYPTKFYILIFTLRFESAKCHRYIYAWRASAIYGIAINWRYTHKSPSSSTYLQKDMYRILNQDSWLLNFFCKTCSRTILN